MLWQLRAEGNTKTKEQLIQQRSSKKWPGGSIHRRLREFGLYQIRTLSADKRNEVMSSYTKIIVVRHPFERLKSVYRDKLHADPETAGQKCQSCNSWGRSILKKGSRNLTKREIKAGRGVSFDEFVYYAHFHRDPHWTPENNLCHPCQIKYDYILKVETMREDAEQLALCVFNSTLPFISSNPSDKSITANATIPDKLRKRIYKLYKIDTEMFGYE